MLLSIIVTIFQTFIKNLINECYAFSPKNALLKYSSYGLVSRVIIAPPREEDHTALENAKNAFLF